MQIRTESRSNHQTSRRPEGLPRGVNKAALNEHELAARWGISVKTLRRWRQQQLGPVFCKLGSRVTYLLSEIEAFEKRCSRYSTSARVAG